MSWSEDWKDYYEIPTKPRKWKKSEPVLAERIRTRLLHIVVSIWRKS